MFDFRKKRALLIGLITFSGAITAAAYGQGIKPDEILNSFVYRTVGPARQNGRVLHVVVNEKDPYTFYLAPATGGVWKTTNNGTTFSSVLPKENMISIGHMAMAPSDPNVLWIGTGDAASGRIPLRGFGVWKSADAGKTWAHMGLTDTRHIGRIAVHPRNPDIVYVAAVGYHFSFNAERGLYKTTNGGRTWDKVFFISDKVGVVDVVLDPKNPDIVLAAAYDKQRVPWNFDEGGPASGIYRSRDAGKTWTRLGGGLPTGKIARIGLAVWPKNPSIMYATVDNVNPRPETPPTAAVSGSGAARLSPAGRLVGGEVYRSENGGDTWTKMNRPEDSIGGGKWYGWIFIDPNNDKVVYVPSTNMNRSLDGGRTWGKSGPESIARSFHVDYHGLWIDPKNSKHLILGSDGGLAVSYDFAATWDVFDHLPLAQFYAVGVDMDEPYNIYGGLQDNGSIRIPSNGPSGAVTRDDWKSVGGGDGMVNIVDPEDSRWLYNASQNGAIQRVDQKTGLSRSIRPTRTAGKPPLRFLWTTPMIISAHNSRILYAGAQVLFRSLNRGDSWQEISPDLTTNDPDKMKGNIEYGTLTTVAESPLTPGLLWTGSDDGKVQMTKNGGGAWTDATPALAASGGPAEYYVTRVFPSAYKEGTAYVSKAGWHRDDFRPLIFKTDDYGATWTSVSGNLPEGTVYVVVEDRKNPNLLFAGTELGVYATLDGGKNWAVLGSNLPPYALVMDLLIHPRENDLIAATHGRGLWITDITPLQEMKDSFDQETAHLFEVESKVQWPSYRTGLGTTDGDRKFAPPNEPLGLTINYYLKNAVSEKLQVRITDLNGEAMAVLEGKPDAGLHSILWDMRKTAGTTPQAASPAATPASRRMSRLVPPGEYIVILEIGEKKWTKRAVIRPAPQPD